MDMALKLPIYRPSMPSVSFELRAGRTEKDCALSSRSSAWICRMRFCSSKDRSVASSYAITCRRQSFFLITHLDL